MRFMMFVKATKLSEAGGMPTEEVLTEQLKYHEELLEAGVLRAATGLRPTSDGWRITYAGSSRTVIDGPFSEESLIAGYTLIEVASREEAMDWAMRYPNP